MLNEAHTQHIFENLCSRVYNSAVAPIPTIASTSENLLLVFLK